MESKTLEESKHKKQYNLNYSRKMWVNISAVRNLVNVISSQTIEFGISMKEEIINLLLEAFCQTELYKSDILM